MKTLCTEGKSGCGRVRILLSFYFLFFTALHSQIPINGFCGVSVFETSKEYKNLFLSDLNFDKKEDIILYDKISNSLLFHLSNVKNNFSKPIKKFFYFPVSKIEEIGGGKVNRTFLFLSRKEKLIGLASISKTEKIRLLDIVSYKSTPSNFSVKTESSGKPIEAVIYGEPFEGLALLKIENSTISEKRIFPDNVFKSAVWIDLNYDGRADIAAYDIFDGELLLLINDGEDNFKLERKIKLEDRLRAMKNVDWNGDGYRDLFYSNDDGFKILLGDSVSSFTKKIFFSTETSPKKNIVHDFNGDGKPDVAWLQENEDGVFFLYSNDDSSYSAPQKYFHGTTFTDLKLSSTNNDASVFLLSNNGKIFKINNIEPKKESNMILAAGSPLLIDRFKTNRFNDMSLAYFDSLTGNVNLLMSDTEIFNDAFQFHAANNHSQFRAFFTSDSIRTFLLFSKREKLLEVFRFNIYDYSVESFEIYADRELADAVATDAFHGDYLLTLTKENDYAEINKYAFVDGKFLPKEKMFSAVNILDAAISYRKKLSVCYLIEKNDSLFMEENNISDGGETSSSFLGKAKEFATRIYFLPSRKFDYPAIVNKDKRTINIIASDGKIKTVSLPNEISLPLKKIKSFYFMGFNYLFIQPKESETVYEMQLDGKMNFLGGKKFIESERVIDYFGAEFMKFPYLFYINKNNEIKFKKF